MARFILAPFGGAGDTHSFLWLGRLLKSRGHPVHWVGPPALKEVALEAGFEFSGVKFDTQGSSSLANLSEPPGNVTNAIHYFGLPALKSIYNVVCKALLAAPSILVVSLHNLAARAVADKYRVPLVTVHTQPYWNQRSIIPPVECGPDTHADVSEPGMRKSMQLEEIASVLGGDLRNIRHEAEIFTLWQKLQRHGLTSEMNIMLFPEWFSGYPPALTGRNLFDNFPVDEFSAQIWESGSPQTTQSPGQDQFLLTREVSDAWSQMLFDTGLRAGSLIGLRALVAADSLVDGSEYKPREPLPPGLRAVVHEGNVGMVSQCLMAGIPQLIFPTGRWQQDNADRLRWLGVGETLSPSNVTVPSVASSLWRLVSSPSVKSSCESLQGLMRQRPAGKVAIEGLEDFASQQWTASKDGNQALAF